ncbi:hypothetical protein JD793_004954 [Citrobacter braakii]|nr:hypothetical protein [Citrobacter braakii]
MDNTTPDISELAPLYPRAAAGRLMELLKPHALPASPTAISRGKRRYDFTLNGKSMLYLVVGGTYFARRRSDHKILCTVISPIMIGWVGLEAPQQLGVHTSDIAYLEGLYLECRDAGQLLVLPLREAYRLVLEYNQLIDVMELLSYHIKYLLCLMNDISDASSREVVLKMLSRLMTYPDEFRMSFTAVQFIEERCHLSRRTILRELSRLREEGNIDMDSRGRLLALHLLPET